MVGAMRNRPSPTRALTAICSALVVAIACVFGSAGPASASPPVPSAGYGFSEGTWMLNLSPEDLDRELDAVAQTGATWLRVLFDWNRAEPAAGQYAWAVFDGIVDAAHARGLRVLGNIAFTPSWARPPLSFFTAPPTDPDAFADFSRAVVGRYGSRVSDWEIWNEPNLPLFFGFSGNNAARYTTLLQSAYTAIKDVQPGSTVIAAGLSRVIGPDSPPAFLAAMYDAGAKGYFDAAALHPYVFPGGIAADPDNGWSDIARFREVMVAHGDGGKKIWMTELGAPTSSPSAEGVSQEEQARQITDVLSALSRLDYSGPAFIYSIRDNNSSSPNNREDNFGALLTTDFQPKFAAGVLAAD